MKYKRKTYLETLNEALKKYQYLINFLAIFVGFTALTVTIYQSVITNIQLNQSLYTFKGEQYPILSFKTLSKEEGMLQVENILADDMLFQSAVVYWHPIMNDKISNPPIRIHDKIWFLTPMTTYLEYTYDFEKYFKKNKYSEFLICNMPAALGINYVKYGESRIINAVYNIEFSVQRNKSDGLSKYIIELHGAYLLKYLEPESDVHKELGKRDFIYVTK
jgi:hypothetical protein